MPETLNYDREKWKEEVEKFLNALMKEGKIKRVEGGYKLAIKLPF